jgi:hypothetical protein
MQRSVMSHHALLGCARECGGRDLLRVDIQCPAYKALGTWLPTHTGGDLSLLHYRLPSDDAGP